MLELIQLKVFGSYKQERGTKMAVVACRGNGGLQGWRSSKDGSTCHTFRDGDMAGSRRARQLAQRDDSGGAVTKREAGEDFPAEAFAYVPDSSKPSTWKLRLWESLSRKETRSQVGRAVAAFSPGGFRGERVQIPPRDLAGVKAKVRAAFRKVNPDRPIPPAIR